MRRSMARAMSMFQLFGAHGERLSRMPKAHPAIWLRGFSNGLRDSLRGPPFGHFSVGRTLHCFAKVFVFFLMSDSQNYQVSQDAGGMPKGPQHGPRG